LAGLVEEASAVPVALAVVTAFNGRAGVGLAAAGLVAGAAAVGRAVPVALPVLVDVGAVLAAGPAASLVMAGGGGVAAACSLLASACVPGVTSAASPSSALGDGRPIGVRTACGNVIQTAQPTQPPDGALHVRAVHHLAHVARESAGGGGRA